MSDRPPYAIAERNVAFCPENVLKVMTTVDKQKACPRGGHKQEAGRFPTCSSCCPSSVLWRLPLAVQLAAPHCASNAHFIAAARRWPPIAVASVRSTVIGVSRDHTTSTASVIN